MKKKKMIEIKKGEIYQIRAKPNSSQLKIVWNDENQRFDVFIHSPPIDGKANDEIVKLFKKTFKVKIEIISGFKGKDKKIKII